MKNLDNLLLKVKHFKCFGESEQGFDDIKPINLIIGRNNSGKSTLLELIDYAVKGGIEVEESQWHAKKRPLIIAEAPLTEEELKVVFREGRCTNIIPGADDWMFGKKLIGTRLRWSLGAKNSNTFISIGNRDDGSRPLDSIQHKDQLLQGLVTAKKNPLMGKEFRRIFAERDIVPEKNQNNIEVEGHGKGVTNVIQNFLNKASYQSSLVEKTLLKELNLIFEPDAMFSTIVCQKLEDDSWEIYLEEKSKGRIALSHSGSGLKTIIIVLVYIHLVPFVAKKKLSDFIFAFEELENNLHPALLRRLLSYLHEQAKNHGCLFFLTTHSNVEIDLFSKNKDAQILHITHDGEQASCRTVKTYIENKDILDDLDVRASDLLQSNVVIWVEGPSDRIYLNRWIDLYSNGTLSEGNHYQCVFYGGRLLSHLSSKEPELVEKSISILRVNRNPIILIDSDKRTKGAKLNDTKNRMISEIEALSGIAWVTKGREIENYISNSVISKWLKNKSVRKLEQYGDFFEYLNEIKKNTGKKFKNQKPLLAEQLIPHMTRESLTSAFDLEKRIREVCEKIKEWNNIT